MIVELTSGISKLSQEYLRIHEPEDALARASYEYKMLSECIEREMGPRRTLSMDPKKRSRCLPFPENATLKEPGCCSLVMSTTRNVMIRRRVGWGEPSVKTLPQLVSCKDVRHHSRYWRS